MSIFKKLFGKKNYFILKMVDNDVTLKSDKKEFTLNIKDGKVVYIIAPQEVKITSVHTPEQPSEAQILDINDRRE